MIRLACVKRTDSRYQSFRDRHYVPNRGTHGQQLHYLVFAEDQHVGIISGASAVYGCAPRDKFFDLSKERKVKEAQINSIVNNVVFRLEHNRSIPSLATRVLALWRKRISADWEELYGVQVAGFETFVIEEERDGLTDRRGTLYLADNWTLVGTTKGNTKAHDTASSSGGMTTKHTRRKAVPKLILCIRRKRIKLPETYRASWKDKETAKERQRIRKAILSRDADR